MKASLVGQKLGKYELTELLGQGGMATVYKAYQSDIDRYVAVKVLPTPEKDNQFVQRFRLEARTIARLQHPHILPLYDYGDENNVLFLVMAYADGGSLADRIRRGGMPLAEIQHVFEETARALDYAHRQSVIHRDIKPDNILLDHEGHALLSDFGIVKLLENNAGTNITLTEAGGIVGTPAYMSPEQAQGLPLTHQTDIYSLGIVVYEMLIGSLPFSAETPMQLAIKHITTPVPPVLNRRSNMPPALDTVLQRALNKDPSQRYASATDFYDDFRRVMQGEPPRSTAVTDMDTATAPAVALDLAAFVTPEAVPSVSPTAAPIGTQSSSPNPTFSSPSQPTIITQSASNPLILLGGFAVIALLIVAVVFILQNGTRQAPETPTQAAPTSVVAVAATATPRALAVIPENNAVNFGKASYSSQNAPGDSISIQVNELAQPPNGTHYAVWLFNTLDDDALHLGDVRLDPLGDGQLTYTSDSASMLPIHYNAVLITQQDADSDAPSGRVLYHGSLPAEVISALSQILVTSPDGIPSSAGDTMTSLLDGAIQEANIAKQHAGLAAAATSSGSLHTHAEHTINILQGTNEDYNGNGRGENPGRGYGIPYFLDRIEAQLDSIAAAPTAESLTDNQIDLIRVCIVNTRGWMNGIIDRESQFFTVEDLASVQTELHEATDYADALLNGVDLNQNGRVDPFEGECGLQQINSFGVAVGNMDITAGSLPEVE